MFGSAKRIPFFLYMGTLKFKHVKLEDQTYNFFGVNKINYAWILML
jgi:hypothetical protein